MAPVMTKEVQLSPPALGALCTGEAIASWRALVGTDGATGFDSPVPATDVTVVPAEAVFPAAKAVG